MRVGNDGDGQVVIVVGDDGALGGSGLLCLGYFSCYCSTKVHEWMAVKNNDGQQPWVRQSCSMGRAVASSSSSKSRRMQCPGGG